MTVPPEIDYEDFYHALDLVPGAPLQEIEDRARLLRAAFEPELLPPQFRAVATERMRIIDRAAVELRRYCTTHGAPPPIGCAAQTADAQPDLPAVGRLVEALAGALEAYQEEKRSAAAAARRQAELGVPPGSRPPGRPGGLRQPYPRPASATVAPAVLQPAANVNAPAAPTPADSPEVSSGKRSMLLKVSIVGIVLALTVWLQVHRSGGAEPAAAAPPSELSGSSDWAPAPRYRSLPRPTGAAAAQPPQNLHDVRSLGGFGR